MSKVHKPPKHTAELRWVKTLRMCRLVEHSSKMYEIASAAPVSHQCVNRLHRNLMRGSVSVEEVQALTEVGLAYLDVLRTKRVLDEYIRREELEDE